MIKTFQYRIYPTKKQVKLLEQTLDECRWAYNKLLEQRKTTFANTGTSPSRFDQTKILPILKDERVSLKVVYAQVLQNVAARVDLAFRKFYLSLKEGKTVGFPRFKNTQRYNSFTFPQRGFSLFDDKNIRVANIGDIKIKLHRPIKGELKTCTIKRSSTGKWNVFIVTEVQAISLEKSTNQVGIDVGLKVFAMLSNGEEIKIPKFFRREEKALAKAQRKYAQLVKGAPKQNRRRKCVSRIHERVRFRRDNFTHQESRKIVDQYGIICVEDLKVHKMLHNSKLAKSIFDASWSEFFSKLSCKAEEAGRQYAAINPAYTSQTCNSCQFRQKMPLNVREFKCPNCQFSLDRDHNAALNILAIGLDSLGLAPRSSCLTTGK